MNLSKPPRKGARKRIRPPGQKAAVPQPKESKKPRKARHKWFWAAHNAKAVARAARWGEALVTLRTRRARGQEIWPDQRIAKISRTWREQISAAARKHNVSEALLLGVVVTESLGNPNAKSPKGAQGLMQLIPATASRFGVTDAFDPQQNVDAGAAYLAFLLKKFDEDPILALAGYNAGENAVVRHSGVPPYVETRDYVAKVFDAIAGAEKLCITAPTGPRSPCRFRPGGV